jgi:hypothetical protein
MMTTLSYERKIPICSIKRGNWKHFDIQWSASARMKILSEVFWEWKKVAKRQAVSAREESRPRTFPP